MSHPPGPTIPLAVRIWRGLRDPLGYLTSAERDFGDIVALRQGRTYAVFHPDYIKHILQDNAKNYEKGAKYRAALRPIMGNGVFTSEGKLWLRQRRLAQSAFRRARMAMFADNISACVAGLVEDWRSKAQRGAAIDLRRSLIVVTLRMTVRSLFNVEPDMNVLVPAIEEVTDQIRLGAQFLPFHMPKWIQTPARRRFAAAKAVIDNFVYEVIARHKNSPELADDLVGLLMQARDEETGEQMSELQLHDELITMLVAGHDTVTDSTLWTLALLAEYPQFLPLLREELQQITGNRLPTLESLKDLNLLGRVIHESLRLYPPGWAFGRTALQEDEIGGYKIPAGALVGISPYVMHRSARYWDEPLRFDPDRFLPERMAGRPRFTYFPFGGGQRQCIGEGLAMIEMPLLLAGILQNFEFDLLPASSITPSPRISLRPRDTVWITLRALQARSS